MFSGWVYILTNNHNTVLYVGVTNDLPTRLWEHRTKRNPKCFTARYNLNKLVYYKGYELVVEAIPSEKMYKRRSRKWKVKLIEAMNHEWRDLTEDVSKLWR
jgi:putative endonuclease